MVEPTNITSNSISMLLVKDAVENPISRTHGAFSSNLVDQEAQISSLPKRNSRNRNTEEKVATA